MEGHRAGTGLGGGEGRARRKYKVFLMCIRLVVGGLELYSLGKSLGGTSLGSHMKRHGKRSHAYDLAQSVCQKLKPVSNVYIHPTSNKQRFKQ